jgi:hypothetical protein
LFFEKKRCGPMSVRKTSSPSTMRSVLARPPTCSSFSMIVLGLPRRDSSIAHASPAGPPPRIRMSLSLGTGSVTRGCRVFGRPARGVEQIRR